MAARKTQKSSLNTKHRDAVRAGMMMSRLENFANAVEGDANFKKSQMTPAQVSAAQILLKKLVPDLSSVEQTIVDEKELMSEEQLLSQMEVLVQSNPGIAHLMREMLVPKEALKKAKAA